MYPLIELGPLRLATGGLLLLLAAFLFSWLLGRAARHLGGDTLAEHADAALLPAIVGAALGGRLWYGLVHFDAFSASLSMFAALRLSDMAWPGAMLGGALLGGLWALRHEAPLARLADAAALALPLPQALASVGMLLSGEAFGRTTSLPWGLPLLGTIRHPTQLYYALAAALSAFVLYRMSRSPLEPGMLAAVGLALQGLAMLLVEPLRANPALFPNGIHVGQVFGLALILAGLFWARHYAAKRPSVAPVLE
jgi:phosphatidylglycerol:prolipoprotein diacylglycerol transferase